MARVVLGGIVGGVVMWIVGFLFWVTPLSRIALSVAPDAAGAAVQSALAQQLGPSGGGAYPIPWPGTEAGTVLYGQGPSAMVFLHPGGLPVVDSGALIGGLALAVVCALLIAAALYMRRGQVADLNARLRLVVLLSLAATLYTDIGQPVFNHMP
jgi:hypothetical protein